LVNSSMESVGDQYMERTTNTTVPTASLTGWAPAGGVA
jgi:hypothetical protein